MFLFNVGFVTLMNMDSLIFLIIHSNHSRTTGEGSAVTIQGMGKFKLRDCNFRNHRIFTLKCISNELVPVKSYIKNNFKNREG